MPRCTVACSPVPLYCVKTSLTLGQIELKGRVVLEFISADRDLITLTLDASSPNDVR